MKIGLILGSFDPIHIGHIAMATEALNAGYVDRVIFIIAKQNVWKTTSTDYEIRVEMVTKAIFPICHCSVSRIEANITEPYYSYKSLEKLKTYYPDDDLYIIGGSDMLSSIDKWSHFEWIKNNFKFIGAIRNKQAFSIKVDACINPNVDISSTKIRNLVKLEKITQPWVPLTVENLIIKYNLYK